MHHRSPRPRTSPSGGDTWLYAAVCDGDTCVARDAKKPAAPTDEFDLGDLSKVDVSGPID